MRCERREKGKATGWGRRRRGRKGKGMERV
jgi:hypothetical protein